MERMKSDVLLDRALQDRDDGDLPAGDAQLAGGEERIGPQEAPDDQQGAGEGEHGEQIGAGELGEADLFGDFAHGRREVRAEHRADGGGPDDDGEGAAAVLRGGEIGGGIARLQTGGGGAADADQAEQRQREEIEAGADDDDERAEDADGVADHESGAAAAQVHDARDGDGGQRGADHAGGGGEAAVRLAGELGGQQRADGGAGGDPHPTEHLRAGQDLHQAALGGLDGVGFDRVVNWVSMASSLGKVGCGHAASPRPGRHCPVVRLLRNGSMFGPPVSPRREFALCGWIVAWGGGQKAMGNRQRWIWGQGDCDRDVLQVETRGSPNPQAEARGYKKQASQRLRTSGQRRPRYEWDV